MAPEELRLALRPGAPIWIALLFAAATAFAAVPDSLPPEDQTPPPAPEESAARPAEDLPTASAETRTDPLETAISHEISRARDSLANLESARSDLARSGREEGGRASAAAERAAQLALDLGSCPAGTPEADRLYVAIVDELREARPELRAALDSLRSPPSLPGFEPALDPAGFDTPTLASLASELRKVYGEIADARELLARDQERLGWAAAKHRAARVLRLNSLRIDCLSRLSRAKRDRILGFNREGIAQLRREVDHLALSARFHMATRLREVHLLPAALRDIFALGEATYDLLRALLVLAVALFLKRRIRPILDGTRRFLLARSRSVRWTRRVEGGLGAVAVLFPWSLFLITLYALRWALGAAAAWPEVDLPYRVGVLYGTYRLVTDVLFALTVRAAQRYRLRLDDARADLITRSLRTILRTVTAIAILLVLSERFLGRGYLYHLVVNLTGLVLLWAAVRVLTSWRNIIVDAYLQQGPSGWLADLVSRTRDRWYGVFLAAASFAWLAGRAALVLARDFALGFDQTRKALAFLFRRRIEKQAERLGYSAGALESLPPALVEAFTPEPVWEGPRSVDHFPGLDRLRAALSEWKEGRRAGSFLLIGGQGIGKTSWLARASAGDLPVRRLSLGRRVTTAQALAETLAKEVSPGASATASLDRLREDLLSSAPRLILLEGGEQMFLGAVGGYEALEAFLSLVQATDRKVFWLCSFAAPAFEHLAAVRPDLAVFSCRQALPAWSEGKIRDLIRARIAASGVALTYEDLVVDRVEGIEGEARLLETEEGYVRMLWHYSEGNPAVALHFWLRSLVPESPDRSRVRLFKGPPAEELEDVGEEGLFLLSTILTHDSLTLPEAVRTTGYPEPLCRIYLDRCADLGVLRPTDGRYRLTTHWQPSALRLLRRKNLLAD